MTTAVKRRPDQSGGNLEKEAQRLRLFAHFAAGLLSSAGAKNGRDQ